ncbi:aldo/keto reductase [Natronosporangium hydrolyticum]|uniref:Aldo/keto reductase n=1 Tax=Natronosporangium hydrolyticum TaxID=2811111 RepID=A0A895YNN4_9ACTN|nr:aldo/keto reductase [Natronosporangium hydrolyticum]QSB15548.1 aldo/keto reductase [Natronosporangium hydrolyticum]
MPEIPDVLLNNGVRMPQLGFGVYRIPDDEAAGAVAAALDAGYRSIDTASLYRNEAGVGRAVAAAAVPRAELFITTKVWNDDQGYDATMRAFDASLARLGLDYLDLYLIHWPVPARDRYVETWQAMEKLVEQGRVRAIGVSNFQPAHLERLRRETATMPAVNQVELHPFLQQAEVRAYHDEHHIATEAWSPLAKGGDALEHPTITGLASKHGRTPAQVVLRWQLQLGNIAIPKSVTPGRMQQNLAVFDFTLAPEELAAMGRLDRGGRLGPDPDTHGA